MSFHAVYITPQPPHYADGPHIASTKGWSDFCDYVLARGEQFPACEHLTDNVVSEQTVPGSLGYLRDELPRVQAEASATHPDVAHVAAGLSRALDEAPAGCLGLYVSDGEPGDEEPWESNANG